MATAAPSTSTPSTPTARAGDMRRGLDPLRADQEVVGGLIHKPMYERLILADYAIADLTTANANVFYELGVRHAVRPYSTVLVSADVKRVPFDLAPDRVLAYALTSDGRPADPAKDREALVEALRAAREAATTDSPVFQLIGDLPRPEIDRLKTDVFRDEAGYSAETKERLSEARSGGAGAVREVESDLGSLEDVEAGILVDLLLSYRSTEAWDDMTRLVEAMPEPRAAHAAGSRAVRLRAQPRRPLAGRRARTAGRARGPRTEQRDVRPARQGVQGPLGGRARRLVS